MVWCGFVIGAAPADLDVWSWSPAGAGPLSSVVRGRLCELAEGDNTRFYSVALQVAAGAARNGQNRFAQDLRELVDALREQQSRGLSAAGARLVPVAAPRGELAQLLTVTYSQNVLADLALEQRAGPLGAGVALSNVKGTGCGRMASIRSGGCC